MFPDNLDLLEGRKKEILSQLEEVENKIAEFKCNEVLREEAYKKKEDIIKSIIPYIQDRVVFCYTEYPKDKFIGIEASVVHNDKTFRQVLNSTLLEKDKFRFLDIKDGSVYGFDYDSLVNPNVKYNVAGVCKNLIENLKETLIRRLASMIVRDNEKSSD